MNIRTSFLFAVFLSVSLLAAACAQTAPAARQPKVTLSRDVAFHKEHVEVRGTGFTPKTEVRSHLLKSNGTEFPVLPILVDDKGEFTHDIDSLLLQTGTHELWVIDSTGVSSNVAKFEVAFGQRPLPK